METQAGAQPSASSPTPGADVSAGGFPLVGPTQPLDPLTHAFRPDLADVALAGRMIASHYAEPLERRVTGATPLLAEPDKGSAELASLAPGDVLLMLDCSRGWAWGYAGVERLVGYVRAEAVSA